MMRSPTRFASRTTLPARGRDVNPQTRDRTEMLMRFRVCVACGNIDAASSLPLTGRVVRREPNRVG